MLGVDLEGGPGGVELLGPAPEGVIDAEVADLAVKHGLTDVTLDKVVGRPFDGPANRVQLAGRGVRLRPTDGAPGQERRRRGHCESELHEVAGYETINLLVSLPEVHLDSVSIVFLAFGMELRCAVFC